MRDEIGFVVGERGIRSRLTSDAQWRAKGIDS
jgi:hypothetical protein